MFYIGKQFRFEAAHVLDEAPASEKCKSIHGHSYLVEVIFACPSVSPKSQMVLDFSTVKKIVGPIIEELDHSLLISSGSFHQTEIHRWHRRIVVLDKQPTAEYLAQYLFYRIRRSISGESLSVDLRLDSIQIWETGGAWAAYKDDEELTD